VVSEPVKVKIKDKVTTSSNSLIVYLQIVDVKFRSKAEPEPTTGSVKIRDYSTESVKPISVKVAPILADEKALEKFEEMKIKVVDAGEVKETTGESRRHSINKINAKGTVLDDGMHPASLIIVQRITSGIGLSDSSLVSQNTETRGYMRLGDKKYVLKNAVITDDKIKADIVGGERIELDRVVEDGFSVIKGSITMDGTTLEVYLLE